MNKTVTSCIGILLVTILATFSVSSCNTMEGFGKDMQKAGEAIEEKAAE